MKHGGLRRAAGVRLEQTLAKAITRLLAPGIEVFELGLAKRQSRRISGEGGGPIAVGAQHILDRHAG